MASRVPSSSLREQVRAKREAVEAAALAIARLEIAGTTNIAVEVAIKAAESHAAQDKAAALSIAQKHHAAALEAAAEDKAATIERMNGERERAVASARTIALEEHEKVVTMLNNRLEALQLRLGEPLASELDGNGATLTPDSRATICGLRERQDLNGAVVTVREYHAANRRWSVQIEGTGEVIRVLAANVMPELAKSVTSIAPQDANQQESSEAAYKTQLNFFALITRQLLARHSLDGKKRAHDIMEYVAHSGGPVATASERFAHHFAMPATIEAQQHAGVFLRFFGPSMSSREMDNYVTSTLLRMPAAAVEGTEAVHLRNFLSSEEIGSIFAAANERQKLDGHNKPTRRSTAAKDATQYAYDVQYGKSHVALNLHRDGHFQRVCPKLLYKINAAMRSQPSMFLSPLVDLNVRCIEFHTYTAGDGLSTQGHRDQGSVFTISILLSETHEFDGGTFLTCDRSKHPKSAADGTYVHHRISKGDAILFHSEKMHNVAPITSGLRNALIIELWLKATNVKDRHQ